MNSEYLTLLSNKKNSTVYTDKEKTKVYKVFNNIYEPSIIHNWIKEIMFLKNLNHTNVIKLVDYNIDNRVVIIYPYYKCIAQKTIFTDLDIIICLKDLFSGLEYCHYMGLLHKDIKPSNLFYISDNNMIQKLVIGDFGLSNINITEYSKNNHFLQIGSYTHCAPEIFMGYNGYTSKSDIWACAICLIYFMTGMSVYDLSIYDPYFIKCYSNYLEVIDFKKKNNMNVVRKIMKELHRILFTDLYFREKIIDLACSKRKYSSSVHFLALCRVLLNNMLESNPDNRADIKDMQLLISKYNDKLEIEKPYIKKAVYLFDWRESISLDNEINRNIMKILNASIIQDLLKKITLIQKRFLINKTMKLIEIYTEFTNSLSIKDILLCLQIMLLLGFSDEFIINKELLCSLPRIMQNNANKDIVGRCDFIFPIPNIFI